MTSNEWIIKAIIAMTRIIHADEGGEATATFYDAKAELEAVLEAAGEIND